MKQTISVMGEVNIKEINPITGEVVSDETFKNLVTNVGLAAIVDFLDGDNPTTFDYMAIGSGTTPAAAGDTALETELDRSSSPITPTQPTATTISWVETFTAGAGKSAITEMGMLDADSVGNLFNHLIFTARDNLNNDLQITYTVTIASS